MSPCAPRPSRLFVSWNCKDSKDLTGISEVETLAKARVRAILVLISLLSASCAPLGVARRQAGGAAPSPASQSSPTSGALASPGLAVTGTLGSPALPAVVPTQGAAVPGNASGSGAARITSQLPWDRVQAMVSDMSQAADALIESFGGAAWPALLGCSLQQRAGRDESDRCGTGR